MSTQVKQCKCKEPTKEELFSQIGELIEGYKDKKKSLIQILHMAQGIYGYLPLELQQYIANKVEIPLSKVSGVVTFYSFFATKEKGENTIQVCLGTACYVRGGKKIVDRLKEILGVEVSDTTLDKKFTLDVMRCIGACSLAPCITINDKVFKQVNPEKLQNILEEYY